MKNIIFLTLLFVSPLLLMVTGCHKAPVTSQVFTKSDSSIVKESIRVDTVIVPGDTVRLVFQVPCPEGNDPATGKPKPRKPAHYSINNSRVSQTIDIDSSGVLSAKCECKEWKALVSVKNTDVKRLVKENQTLKTVKYRKQATWLDQTCRWLVLVFVLYHVLKIIVKIYFPPLSKLFIL